MKKNTNKRGKTQSGYITYTLEKEGKFFIVRSSPFPVLAARGETVYEALDTLIKGIRKDSHEIDPSRYDNIDIITQQVKKLH